MNVELERALAAIPRFIPLDENLATAGQPSEEQLAIVAAAGFSRVINLGLHDERVPVFVALDRILRQGWEPDDALSVMRAAWQPDETWLRFIGEACSKR